MTTAVMQSGETRDTVETWWRNIYLRGQVLFDETGDVGGRLYGGPAGGIPFGRGFVIAQDGTVALASFGYDPDLIIDTIQGLLGTHR